MSRPIATMPHIEVFEVTQPDGSPNPPFMDLEPGFYWWSCAPGCLPDSDPQGPFTSEQDAIEDCCDDLVDLVDLTDSRVAQAMGENRGDKPS